jgi:Ti-type conjugative transfer relaxase TraA
MPHPVSHARRLAIDWPIKGRRSLEFMAVAHFSVGIVSRSAGRSAVLSAAYRHCARMEYQREARMIDYTRKQGLAHEAFMLPPDAPDWVKVLIADRTVAGASEAFWNRVEAFEKRSDAQLAKDVTIALPVELSPDQNIALVHDFVESHVTSLGMVADWVFHDAPGNPHIHLMMTLRPLTKDGFGAKKVALTGPDGCPLRDDRGKILYGLWAGGVSDFNAFRDAWFSCQNRHLARAGLELRIDGRSYEKQGLDLVPTVHLGVSAKAIERKAIDRSSGDLRARPVLDRLREQEDLRLENASRIVARPDLVIDMIERERSVFDHRDIAKILNRYIDEPELFQGLMARILDSPRLLCLALEGFDLATGLRTAKKYTTRELVRLEAEMVRRAQWLARHQAGRVEGPVLDHVLSRHENLSDEQKTAVMHVAGGARIAAVIGRAGAGKTTMMKAAREALEIAGNRVVGGALAGKAADGLQREAGIASRTLSSWELSWSKGRDLLDQGCVFVLDEAGMVSSRQMARLIEAVTNAGASLVLIGDPDQLQPIEAGAAFRAIADRIGYAELETIYRQHASWMRRASLDLARGETGKAIGIYRAHDRLVATELKSQAVRQLIDDWVRDHDETRSSLILAHLKRDVRLLNTLAREALIERGLIDPGHAFRTAEGGRHFSSGDQIVFLKNDASLGVKNGMLGKVVEASAGFLVVELDAGQARRRVSFDERSYAMVDHGYATTVHKAQGATVDRVKLLASLSLDRHLTYVAMTRHREDLSIYYGRRSFERAGGLVEILSRQNAKETTLDYAQHALYRQALQFAEARGLHLLHVARAVLAHRLEWTMRQGSRLAALAGRLRAQGLKIGRALHAGPGSSGETVSAAPLVSAVTRHARSVAEVVEERLRQDLALQRLWKEVASRLHLVYAEPRQAADALDLQALLSDRSLVERTLSRLVAEPERFGRIRGKTGLLARPGDKHERNLAQRNIEPLVEALGDYLDRRMKAEAGYRDAEQSARNRAALDIPALSPAAKRLLARVREGMEPDRAVAILQSTSADPAVRAELDDFIRRVALRFGERTFLSLAASAPDGEAFRQVTSGMTSVQKGEIAKAWDYLRSAQQLSAHIRSQSARKSAERMQQKQTRGLSLK